MLEFFQKTLSLLLDFNIFKCVALKYIKIVKINIYLFHYILIIMRTQCSHLVFHLALHGTKNRVVPPLFAPFVLHGQNYRAQMAIWPLSKRFPLPSTSTNPKGFRRHLCLENPRGSQYPQYAWTFNKSGPLIKS